MRALLAGSAILLLGIATAMPPARAQSENLPGVRTPGLLDLLFRRDRQRQAEPRRIPPQTQQRGRTRNPAREDAAPRNSTRTAPSQTTATAPAAIEVDKAEDAKTILVIGDFLAHGLSEGLVAAFAENPGVRVISRTNGSSGFVRDDFYDWPAEISAILQEEKPDALVIMLGANDRQEMVVAGTRESARSPAWTSAYEARATALAEAFKAAAIPFVWVGTPPFRFTAMSADMLAFNDVFRAVAEEAGGQFVDVWDGFADENGVFVTTGPDINGQPARLRGNDGINLTKPGKRKLAYFVERPLSRILEPSAPTVQPGVGEMLPTPTQEDVAPNDRTPPLSLVDPALDGGTELLGGSGANRRSDWQDRLAEDGTGRAGRADDFRPPAMRRTSTVERPVSADSTTSISP